MARQTCDCSVPLSWRWTPRLAILLVAVGTTLLRRPSRRRLLVLQKPRQILAPNGRCLGPLLAISASELQRRVLNLRWSPLRLREAVCLQRRVGRRLQHVPLLARQAFELMHLSQPLLPLLSQLLLVLLLQGLPLQHTPMPLLLLLLLRALAILVLHMIPLLPLLLLLLPLQIVIMLLLLLDAVVLMLQLLCIILLHVLMLCKILLQLLMVQLALYLHRHLLLLLQPPLLPPPLLLRVLTMVALRQLLQQPLMQGIVLEIPIIYVLYL